MKKIWILSALIMILITFYQISQTYAKYSSQAKGTVEETIGAWIVKINGENIATEEEVKTFTIEQLNYNSNNNVKEGKIAPGLLGYFDIIIDATEASVAVRYDVKIDFASLDISNAINFSKLVKVVDGVESSEGIIKIEENVYTGVVSLDDIKAGKTNTLRVYIEWTDNQTGENDEADSVLGMQKDIQVSIPVELKAMQYLGEELKEYNS